MAGANTLVDAVVLLLLQNIREGMETGRIADMDAAQTEVEAAIAELGRRQQLERPSCVDDVVAKLLLEIRSLHEKVAQCESQLAEFQSSADALKEETAQIVARTEACNLLVEQQRKENAKVLAAMEGVKTSISTAPPPCHVPESSTTDPVLHPAHSKMAVISFPGGPRAVTIYPPDSPSYQPVIRDERGDVIITFKGPKSLRREGAFRGPLEDIDWCKITRVYGRGPETAVPRTAPPVPRWPDRSQPSPCPSSRGPSDIIARQRQLSISMQTDAFGRVLASDFLTNAESLSRPTSMSSQDSQSSSSAKPDTVITPASTPPSLSICRGKKRARPSDEDEGVSSTETREGVPLPIDPQAVEEPTTPTPIKREASRPLQGSAKHKKFRASAFPEALPAGPDSACSESPLDVTRTV